MERHGFHHHKHQFHKPSLKEWVLIVIVAAIVTVSGIWYANHWYDSLAPPPKVTKTVYRPEPIHPEGGVSYGP